MVMDGGLNESIGDKRFAISYANPVPEINPNEINSSCYWRVHFAADGNQLVV